MGTTPLKYSTSAALLFTEQELGGPCTEIESYPVTVNTAPIVVAQGNGDRVGLVLLNVSVQTIYISLTGSPVPGASIALPPLGGSLSLTVRDDFTLPSRQWSALCGGSAGTLYVLEIIRYTSLELSQS